MTAVHCALVHHPVRDREGHPVASAITNVDVHDLARSARTYGLVGYWVVSPIAAQRLLVERILEHWKTGAGSRRVPERTEALSRCHPIESVEAAIAAITEREGKAPQVWVTAAKAPPGRELVSWDAARDEIANSESPILMLFGTAHGLHQSLMQRADRVLAPIQPGADYNHLSVRAAAAITFDRLFGDRSGSR